MTTATPASRMAVVPPNTENFQKKLRSALDASHLTQTDLAAAVSCDEWRVTPQLIHHYLRGSATPKPDMLVRLARELDVDLAWLCDEADASTEPKPPVTPIEFLDDDAISDELRRRYVDRALELDRSLDGIEKTPRRYDHAAIVVLGSGSANWHGSIVQNLVDEAFAHARLRFEYRAIAHRMGEGEDAFAVYQGLPHALGRPSNWELLIERGVLKRTALADHSNRVLSECPGLASLLEVDAIEGYGSERAAPRSLASARDRFWQVRAPVHLARVAMHLLPCHEYDDLRAVLKRAGIIDDQARVVESDTAVPGIGERIKESLSPVLSRIESAGPLYFGGNEEYEAIFRASDFVDKAYAIADAATDKPWWFAVADAIESMRQEAD